MSVAALDNFIGTIDPGWTNSGMARVNDGQVGATTAGTQATLIRPFGGANDSARIEVGVVVDKTDTAGRWAMAGVYGSTNQGAAIGYLAGTGIITACLTDGYPNGGIGGMYYTIVPDAQLVQGAAYRLSLTTTQKVPGGGSGVGYAMVFDATGRMIASNTSDIYGYAPERFSPSRAIITSTSRTSLIQQYAADTSLAGSTASRDNFQNSCWSALFDTGGNQIATIYLPGRVPPTSHAALIFHGTGAINFTPSADNVYVSYREAMLTAGVPVIYPFGQASAGNADNWGNLAGYNEVKNQVVPWITSTYGAATMLHLMGYSMGGLLANRLIYAGEVPNIRSLLLCRAVLDLPQFWSDGYAGFHATIENAWGYTPPNLAAAQAAWGPYSPRQQALAHPERYKGIAIKTDYSTADGVVGSANNTLAFNAALAAGGVPYSQPTVRPYPAHDGDMVPSTARAHVANALGGFRQTTRQLILKTWEPSV